MAEVACAVEIRGRAVPIGECGTIKRVRAALVGPIPRRPCTSGVTVDVIGYAVVVVVAMVVVICSVTGQREGVSRRIGELALQVHPTPTLHHHHHHCHHHHHLHPTTPPLHHYVYQRHHHHHHVRLHMPLRQAELLLEGQEAPFG